MTRTEQKKFVRDLSKTIADSICEQITDGRVPEEWDGHELRALLSYRHAASSQMSHNRALKPGCKRARDFKNTILINNL